MPETFPAPESKITLIGVADQHVPLSIGSGRYRGEGVFLPEIPDFFTIVNASHQHIQVVDKVGGLWQSVTHEPASRTLRCIVKGKKVLENLRQLMNAVVDGKDPWRIVVRDSDNGFRWLTCRTSTINVKPKGEYDNPSMAEVEVNFIVSTPLWQKFNRGTWLRAADINQHYPVVTFPFDGTTPFWPIFEIEGGFRRIELWINDGDEKQVFDNPTKDQPGIVFISDPAGKSITMRNGQFNGVYAFWGSPVVPGDGHASVNVVVREPSPNFEMRISGKTEVHSAW